MKLISGWIFSGLSTLSGIILLPLVLSKFTTAEINVWFLFFSILGLSEMIVFGFNVTFSRFVAYTYAGTHYLDFQNIKDNNKSHELTDKIKQLSEIYSINRIIFITLSFAYIVVILLIGYFGLKKPINFLENPNSGWIAWYVLVGGNFVRIFSYTYPIFIQGMDKMDKYYNILSFQKIIYISFGFLILFFFPSLIRLSISLGLSLIISAIVFYFYFNRYRNKIRFVGYNKKLFSIIWDSAWKTGIAKIIAPIAQYLSGIIFAQVSIPALSSSYLLTQRVFNMLRQFSDVTFNTFLPQIAMLRSKNMIEKLRIIIFKVSAVSYGIIVFGYLFIIFFVSNILNFINSNATLAPPIILILFSFAYLLSRLGGFQLNLANQANKVIEHKAVLIYSILYFGFIFVFINNMKMWIFPAAMIIAHACTYFFTFKYSYKLYDTTFFKAEKFAFLPSFVLLIIINIFVILW